MRTKTKLAIAVSVTAAALLITIITIQPTATVQAQGDTNQSMSQRASFPMVGITAGQTLRMTVANTIMPNDMNLPPGPVRVVITFRAMNGQLLRNRSGDLIRRAVDLERGDATFIDLDYDALPPGPVRSQVRPVVVVTPPPVHDTNAYPDDAIVSSGEVISNANGRTQFLVFTHPAAARGFNPQPDPPSPTN